MPSLAASHALTCLCSRPLGEDRPWGGNLSPFIRPRSALGMRCLCRHIPLPRGKQLPSPQDFVPIHQDASWNYHGYLVYALPTCLLTSSPILFWISSTTFWWGDLSLLFAMRWMRPPLTPAVTQGRDNSWEHRVAPPGAGTEDSWTIIVHFLFIAAATVLGWSIWESLMGEAGESVKIK